MNRITWILVSAVMALVLGGLGTAAVLRGHEAAPDLATPAGVVLAYALAEQRGDPLTAWNLLAGATQARGDRERYLARAGSNGADRAYLTTTDQRIDADDTASVDLVRTYPGSRSIFGDGSYTSRTTVRLVREGATWRISVPPDDYLLLEKQGLTRDSTV